MFWQTDLTLLFVLIVIAFVAALELGFRLGIRFRPSADADPERTHIASIQASALGLLALLLGFTFAMAVSRSDERRVLVLEEANAIGTAVLRAQLLPVPYNQTAATYLKSHVDARLAFFEAGIDPVRLNAAEQRAATTEAQLWSVARDAVAADTKSIPIGLFVEALNAVIDVHEKRRVAFYNHVPEAALYLLVVVSMAALAVTSYGGGLIRRRHFWSNLTLAVLIAIVLAAILDIDRPRRGLIQVNQDSLVRLKASFSDEKK